MRRVYAPLALIVLLALALAGCGGGGGGGGNGGGGGGTGDTTTLTGIITSSAGSPVSGVTVTISAEAQSPVSDSTDSQGKFAIPGVPRGKSLTMTVAGGNIDWDCSGLALPTTGSGDATMNVMLPPGPVPAGANIMIAPNMSEVATGTTPKYTVQVYRADGSLLYNSYQAVWTVVGDIATQVPSASPYSGRYLGLDARTAGQTARIIAAVALDDGTTATDVLNVSVTDDGGGDEPPGPPGQ